MNMIARIGDKLVAAHVLLAMALSYDTANGRSGSGCGPREEVRLPACGWMHVIERCGQRNALDRWSNFMAWHGRIH